MIEQIPKFNKGDGLSAKQLYELQQAEMRHERELKRKRREERIARAKPVSYTHLTLPTNREV